MHLHLIKRGVKRCDENVESTHPPSARYLTYCYMLLMRHQFKCLGVPTHKIVIYYDVTLTILLYAVLNYFFMPTDAIFVEN